jgi:hypothetical protein
MCVYVCIYVIFIMNKLQEEFWDGNNIKMSKIPFSPICTAHQTYSACMYFDDAKYYIYFDVTEQAWIIQQVFTLQ